MSKEGYTVPESPQKDHWWGGRDHKYQGSWTALQRNGLRCGTGWSVDGSGDQSKGLDPENKEHRVEDEGHRLSRNHARRCGCWRRNRKKTTSIGTDSRAVGGDEVRGTRESTI